MRFVRITDFMQYNFISYLVSKCPKWLSRVLRRVYQNMFPDYFKSNFYLSSHFLQTCNCLHLISINIVFFSFLKV